MSDGPNFPSADITAAARAHVSPVPTSAYSADSLPPGVGLAPAAPVARTSEVSPAEIANLAAAAAARQAPQQAPEAVVATEPEALELNDTTLYRVQTVVDGKAEVELLTGKQVREQRMGARKFTQSMQSLRTAERTLLSERQGLAALQQRAAQQDQLLNDPGRLAAYVHAKYPHLSLAQVQAQVAAVAPQQVAAAPQFDPDTLSTLGDVQRRIAEAEAGLARRVAEVEQRASEQVEANTSKAVAAALSTLQNNYAVANFDRQIEDHIAQLKAEMPVLGRIPKVNDMLRFEVTQLRPESPQAMFDALTEYARAYVEDLNEHYQAASATTLAAKSRLVTHGVAAPTGQAPTNAQPRVSKPFSNGGKGDWGSMTTDALARLSLPR